MNISWLAKVKDVEQTFAFNLNLSTHIKNIITDAITWFDLHQLKMCSHPRTFKSFVFQYFRSRFETHKCYETALE